MNNEKFLLTISIVLYNNNLVMVNNLMTCINKITLNYRLYIIDNSTSNIFYDFNSYVNVIYIKSEKNIGFGAGHNIAINLIKNISNYHLILNPDISFGTGVIESLIDNFSKNPNYGIIMPKIVYPDKSLQTCAKLLPTPFNLILRRLIPKSRLLHNYELKSYKYDRVIEAPFLSGCFMLCRTLTLTKINGFDEKLFLYMEDVDICRRSNLHGFMTIVNPFEFVIHDHEYKPLMISNTLKLFLKSTFYYYNKWGWLFDKNRRILNRKTLSQIK